MTQALPPEPDAYLDALRRALSDLPAEERDDLLLDVEASLAETESDGAESLIARLGPPERFAAELRASAGIPLRVATPPSRSGVLSTIERVAGLLDSSPISARARLALRELAPIWWLVRAYAACALLLVAVGGQWDLLRPFVPLFGTAELGAAVVVMAAIVSVAAGLHARHSRRRGGHRRSWVALNAVLAIATVPALAHGLEAPVSAEQITLAAAPSQPTFGLYDNGVPVQNIYPYTRKGRPLYDVLLYDGFGNPLNITVGPDPDRRVLRTLRGRRVYNSFPIRYYQPGTKVVAHPAAAPLIALPRIVTPVLRVKPARQPLLRPSRGPETTRAGRRRP